MTLDEARTLVDYHCWSRDRLLDAVALLTPDQYTQHIESSFPSLERRLRDVLTNLGEGGVSAALEYRGFDGRPRTEPFAAMLQHVVNHGSYHRGQITMMLRQMGQPPAKPMDLIAFYRESTAPGSVR